MSISSVKTKVIQISGRRDFEGESGGVLLLWYINAGQRYLDFRAQNMKKSAAWDIQSLAAGDYFKTFKYAMSISEIWIADSVDGRSQLDTRSYSLEQLRAKVSAPIATINQGRPCFAAWNVIRLAPGSSTPLPSTGDTADIELKGDSPSEAVIDGILFYPPADQAYTLRILGIFHTQPLDDTINKTSFWTEQYEDALVSATLYKIELIGNRNRAGAAPYLEDLNTTIKGLLQGQAQITMLGSGNRIRL